MNLISTIRDDILYEKVMSEAIPFNKWHSWIEQTLSKQVLEQLVSDKPKRKKKAKKGSKPAATTDKYNFKLDLINFMKKLTASKKTVTVDASPKDASPSLVQKSETE